MYLKKKGSIIHRVSILLLSSVLLCACGKAQETAATGGEGESDGEENGEDGYVPLTPVEAVRIVEYDSGNGLGGMTEDGGSDLGGAGSLDGADGDWEENTESEIPSAEEISITISATGDVTLGNYLGQGYEASFRQTYDQGVGDAYFFENVADIFAADDMTIVNLEGPLTTATDPRDGQIYSISGDPGYVRILTEGNVEVAAMGNNHRLDYKEQGSSDTTAVLEEAGIPYAYDDVYCMFEAKGIKIGVVSVNEVSQGWAVEKYLEQGIDTLREEGADLVLACCHWGREREYTPEDYQKTLGKKCIDWGADLVIGHHPHVLQGVEEYQGKYILYSLGNFCFGANRNPKDKDCMIFQQTFTFINGEKQEDGAIRVIPCSISSVSDRNDYKPTPAQGEEAQRILDKINEYSKSFGIEFDSEGYLVEQ